jgi:hypothetical protein
VNQTRTFALERHKKTRKLVGPGGVQRLSRINRLDCQTVTNGRIEQKGKLLALSNPPLEVSGVSNLSSSQTSRTPSSASVASVADVLPKFSGNPGDFFRRFAPTLVDNGFSVVAIKSRTKQPRHRKWQAACFKPTDLKFLEWQCEHYPADSVGIACGSRAVAIDIDHDDWEKADCLHRIARELLGDTPLVRIGRWPRRTLLYRADAHIDTSHGGKFDIIGHGGNFVAFGLHPETGAPYYWLDDSPADTDANDLPIVTAKAVREFGIAAAAGSRAVVRAVMRPANDNLKSSLAAEVVRNSAGLVVDGRESFLTQLVWKAWRSGFLFPDAIASAAWAAFVAEADLTRPKGSGGKKRWGYPDALVKAKAILRKEKANLISKKAGRIKPNHPKSHLHAFRRPEFWTANKLAEHRNEAAALLSAGSDIAVNSAMLAAVSFETGMCAATVGDLVRATNLSQSAVKKARAHLLESGLWIAERGIYVPVPVDPPPQTDQASDSEQETITRVYAVEHPLYRSILPSPPMPETESCVPANDDEQDFARLDRTA